MAQGGEFDVEARCAKAHKDRWKAMRVNIRPNGIHEVALALDQARVIEKLCCPIFWRIHNFPEIVEGCEHARQL